MDFVIKKGLDLPITGAVNDNNIKTIASNHVAVLGSDYIGMKPTMAVTVGDLVTTGQVLFTCKKNIGLSFTAPGSGKVIEINRGEKRAFQSVVIELDNNQKHTSFHSYKSSDVDAYSSEELRALLIDSGEWTSFRQRPFDKVADVKGQANSIFVKAVDTHPLSPDPSIAVSRNQKAFEKGLFALTKLTEGNTYVCVGAETKIHTPSHDRIKRARFSGPHPAGNVGTHIHMIDPAHINNTVWHIGYQDVISIGHLIETGQLHTERVVSIAGPEAKDGCFAIIRKGAKISTAVSNHISENARVISGSILHGHHAKDAFDFLGHYHNQISIIKEDTQREFLGWHAPGLNKFSIKNVFVSKMIPNKLFNFTSTTHGSYRAMVPIGCFEEVTPLDILPTQLLRSLVSKDTDSAQELGCLELAEEDMGLYTFAAPGKVDFGPILRENLTLIEREG